MSFHRQIDRLAGAAMLLNLAEFCSNYGVEYTKAVYKILSSLSTGKNGTPIRHLLVEGTKFAGAVPITGAYGFLGGGEGGK